MQSHSYSSGRIKKGYSQSEVGWCRFLSRRCFFVLVSFLDLLAAGHRSAGRDRDVESLIQSEAVLQTSHTACARAPHHSGDEIGQIFVFFSFSRENKVQIMSSSDQICPRKGLYSHWYYERAQRNYAMKHK